MLIVHVVHSLNKICLYIGRNSDSAPLSNKYLDMKFYYN